MEKFYFLSLNALDDRLESTIIEAKSIDDAFEKIEEIQHNFETFIHLPNTRHNQKIIKKLLSSMKNGN